MFPAWASRPRIEKRVRAGNIHSRSLTSVIYARAYLLVLATAIVGVLGFEALPVSSPRAKVPIGAPPRSPVSGPLSAADGVLPDGVTVFDIRYPAVTKLDPALLRALRQAASDAAGRRIVFYVDSGWRSANYQEQLLQQAIVKYGSRDKAARWVATPNASAHVSGDAVDIGHADARAWLSRHGADYGLCQIYRNEPWHYELRAAAVRSGCPAMYADPTHDPRMRA
jgi:zinc D-Ala-D-Ala carboxypeptidase